jgi:hypothetical protein
MTDNMFQLVVTEYLARHRISERELARRISAGGSKISNVQINRIVKGEPVDLDTMQKVLDYMGVSLSSVVEGEKEEALAQKIAALIEMDPQLKQSFAELMQKITTGQVSPEILKQIGDYISFLVSR